MSCFSQFFVLSPRGDTIIRKDYRGDVPHKSAENFFREVKFWQGKTQEAPPTFYYDGVTFMYTKTNGLYFVGTMKSNGSGSMMTELLNRLTRVFKDYCGTLTEESIRRNFILLYELLDEMLDYGYAQGTSTEILKVYVFNEPHYDKHSKYGSGFKRQSSKTASSDSVNKPIQFSREKHKKQKNEIFVDIFERISVVFNSNGYALQSGIFGTIQMKSYLAGNPELKLALNEDLIIGKGKNRTTGISVYGSGSSASNSDKNALVILDDMNFHEVVNTEDFDTNRTLSFIPPDGEFAVLNYRVSSEFRHPFRIFPFFELNSPYKVELIIKIRADIPEKNYGGNVEVELPVPKFCQTVTTELGIGVNGQTSEYLLKDHKVVWKIKKFLGGTEQALRVRITFKQQQNASIRKIIGPISMNFEIPMFNVSNLQVKYLRIMENHKSYNPYRWVRYITRSLSYICRI